MAHLPTSNSENGGLTGEEIVISGISGIFPSSKNVAEFMDNLYNRVDMVTETEFSKFDHADLPKYSGKISGIEKFDSNFFRVTKKQALSMDPMCRKLMEQAYCAMYDAGINPLLYTGKKVGVFTAAAFLESIYNLYLNHSGHMVVMSGLSKNMLANRISYWLDAKGPSYHIESFLGSTLGLEHAYNCIKSGICDAAIVGGAEFGNNEEISVSLRRAGLLCMDGKTRCFDKNGDGYARSQAVGVFFLQKAKDAKRIYAEVCGIRTQQGLKQGANFNQNRDPGMIAEFLENIYADIGVSPDEIEYVEANGAANPEADSNELQAIGRVFGRNKTVKVGCVKSNMGNSETFSGVCAVIKLCLAYHKGEIAGNLHYTDPLDISTLKDRKAEVLTENVHFNRGFSAINSFPCDGTNGHVVLKGHFRPKNLNMYKCDLPYLVFVSGRLEKGVQKIFDILKTKPIDQEYLGMLHNIYHINTPGFTYRGYTILDAKDGKTVSLAESTQLYQGFRRPLWFVYSGMGSQWIGMGSELMRIPIFATAIEKCHKILEPKGIDLVKILTSSDKTILDNVINCFVGIAAVQIGLNDILREIEIVPDFIIGHSLGETSCAYCDGCFTAEETILTAYARGIATSSSNLEYGLMAAVGLGYEAIHSICPPEIDIACRNSNEFCTISGPADKIKIFVAELNKKGVFAKEIQSGNIAYHSRYIQTAGPVLYNELKNIIKNPVKRSNKWICTSLPKEKLDDPIGELSSAEYHTNNLLSPVYFEEAASLIPKNAIVVEIAPHGLMQAILKRSHPECTHIPITRRGHENPLRFLFESFGKLYQEGFDLKIDVLYPRIEYPVSTETAILSNLVEWYHEDDWFTYNNVYTEKRNVEKVLLPARTLIISLQDDDYKFLSGHVREGNVVFPEAAVLFYTWETLAMFTGVNQEVMSIGFRDVQFHAEIILDSTETVNLKFSINKGNRYFEVTKDDGLIANGYIILWEANPIYKIIQNYQKIEENEQNCIELVSDDIYNIMKFKGHHYQHEFQSIFSSSSQWNSSEIKFSGDWITFLDSLIQLNILARNYDGISLTKIIKELIINVPEHALSLKMNDRQHGIVNAQFCKSSGIIKCGGVTMKHVIFDDKPIVESIPDVLKNISFDIAEQNQIEKKELLHYKLVSAKIRRTKGLKWMEMGKNAESSIKVYFAGISIKDVQNFIGFLGPMKEFGIDFSGIDHSGNRVMGLVAGGALASKVEPDQDLLWPIPDHWSLQEAATVPLPYVHAYYCLTIKYRLHPGQSVFVTGGAGALGQAVISICLSLGCTVYTSVSDIRKKQFLTKLFPNLNENNIGYSRDISFLNMVVCNSNNERCNVVINCASGEIRKFAMKCVKFNEHFLDISDYDMKNNKQFNMTYLDEDKTYKTVNLSSIFRPENVAEKQLLRMMVSEGIANGTIRPISYVEYSADEVERAFKLLSLSRHRGRVLIKVTDLKTSEIIPRMTYSSNGAYIVCCDEQIDQGMQLINHLVKCGAKELILHLSDKKYTGVIKTQVSSTWKKFGATVTVSTENLEQMTNCVKIIHTAMHVNGIFAIQPNIRDIENQSGLKVFTSLVENLDSVSRNNCPELKYFVILASKTEKFICKTTIKLEKICKERVQLGLPVLMIRKDFLNEPELMNGYISDIQPLSTQTAVRAMEKSLRENFNNVIVYNKNKEKNIFLDVIAKIVGTKNLDSLDEALPIKDLVPYELNLEEIKYAVKEYCKMDISTKCIKQMTLKSLKSIKSRKMETGLVSKLGVFFNFIDHDEIAATEITVPMQTLTSWTEGVENLNSKANNLLLVPGFEGHHHIFKSLCEKIKMRATTLQLSPEFCKHSISTIAYDLKQRIKDKFTIESKFYLLGYSFGVNVALEVAALLEKDGLVGVVYCLDSSPDALRKQIDANLGKLTEYQLQNAVINHLFFVMAREYSNSLEDDILNADWDNKVDKCVKKLRDHVKYSNGYKKDIIEAFYNKITEARCYNPTFELKSKIILLKGISNSHAKYLPADYGLSKYAKNPVEVIDIQSDSVSAPYNSTVASFVNRFLDPVLLEEFRSKNVCERYSI